jgi:hypothetical protein
MTKRTKAVLLLFGVLLCSWMAAAQRRDPLTDQETDLLREAAQEPYKRLKLLIKFADQRLDTVEQIQNEPKAPDRGKRMHDALEDFRQIVDELDDNIDDYSQKQSDLRKALGELISSEHTFKSRLEAVKRVSEDQKHVDFSKLYSFALQDAIEAVSLSLEDAEKTLQEQNAALRKK